jgi:ABC-2 type transport system permease protein
LYQKYNIRPLAAGLFNPERFYLHMVLEVAGQRIPVFPEGELTEASVQQSIEAAIKRSAPGFLKTVGLAVVSPPEPPNNLPPQLRQMQQNTGPQFRYLEEKLRSDYVVRTVTLDDGMVPPEIDLLMLAAAADLNEKQRFALDQYLMRGGAVIVMASGFAVDTTKGAVAAMPMGNGLTGLLETYGVKVEQAFVADPEHAPFPLPVRERRGPIVMQRMQLVPYVFFPDIRGAGFSQGHPVLSGVPNVVANWASPVRVTLPEGSDIKSDVLLQTSAESWVHDRPGINPDFDAHKELGFAPPNEESRARQPVAVSLVGKFTSHYASRPSPLFGAEGESGAPAADGADRTGRTIKESLPDARLVVIGSSMMASDLIQLQLAEGMGEGVYRGNLQFLQNLTDWVLEDTALLEIRTAGAFARTLRPMKDGEKTLFEILNYVVVLLALAGVVIFGATARYRTRPIAISKEAAA